MKTKQQVISCFGSALFMALSLHITPTIASDKAKLLQAEYNDVCLSNSLIQQLFASKRKNYGGSKNDYCNRLLSRQSAEAYRNVDNSYFQEAARQTDHNFRNEATIFFNAENNQENSFPFRNLNMTSGSLPVSNSTTDIAPLVDGLGNFIIQSK